MRTKAQPPTDPLARTVHDCGGTLISVPIDRERFNRELALYAPGCGSPTFVAGTNGGQMRCGAFLTMMGKTSPYFCAACSAQQE